jgi:hypothetical protein
MSCPANLMFWEFGLATMFNRNCCNYSFVLLITCSQAFEGKQAPNFYPEPWFLLSSKHEYCTDSQSSKSTEQYKFFLCSFHKDHDINIGSIEQIAMKSGLLLAIKGVTLSLVS